MMRASLIAAVAGAVAFPAAASAADLTPAGPATLRDRSDALHACPAVFLPSVSVAWQVQVGEGGRAGTVQPRVDGVMGDPVQLPAEPGTYTFPAPHVFSGSA